MKKKILYSILFVVVINICLAASVLSDYRADAKTPRPDAQGIVPPKERVLLQKNIQKDGNKERNVLLQSMLSGKDKIFVVQSDYELLGSTITIPEGCLLELDGGSIKNGSLKGAFQVKDSYKQLFDNVNFVLDESFLYGDYIRPEWFGAKGDYDYKKKKGTDDSYCISKAIEAALLLNVHKVKFSSRPYYVKGAIRINSGDIVLEGVYGELREEFNFSSSKSDIASTNKGSTLVSDTDTPIIITEQGGTHPVVIRNLNFRQEYNNATASTQTKAIWLKGWSGPQSPFIFEYCHFYKFRHAIYIQSDELVYNVSKLFVRHCAFSQNYWCLYFDKTKAKSNYAVDRNVAGELVFEDNACHHNVRGIHVGLNIAPAYIVRNVFEGNLKKFLGKEEAKEDYMNYVGVHNGSTLVFEGNYFEQNTVKHLKFNVTSLSLNYKDSYVTLRDNISVPYKSDDFYTKKVCEIEQSGGWEHKFEVPCNNLHILYSDYDFEVTSGRLGLYFHDKIKNVKFTGNCYVHLYTKELPYFTANPDLNSKEHRLFFNNSSVGLKSQGKPTFSEGTIHYGFESSVGISSASLNKPQSIVYLCTGAKVFRRANISDKKVTECAILSFVDPSRQADNTSVVYNTNDFNYMFAVRRQSGNTKKTFSYQVRPSDAIISQVGIVYSCNDDLSLCDINWDMSPENVVIQDNVDRIRGQKEGDTFFNHTTSQKVTWNNTQWVEYDGAKNGVKRTGAYSEKPLSKDIYVGFHYFCTDLQAQGGNTKGIEIIYKGNNEWVDALGRKVSK